MEELEAVSIGLINTAVRPIQIINLVSPSSVEYDNYTSYRGLVFDRSEFSHDLNAGHHQTL